MRTGLVAFTLPSWPPTALALVRLLLALPEGAVVITEVDWEAGTFRYIRYIR